MIRTRIGFSITNIARDGSCERNLHECHARIPSGHIPENIGQPEIATTEARKDAWQRPNVGGTTCSA